MSGLIPHPEHDPSLDPTPSVEAMAHLRTLLGPAIQAHQAVALLDVGDSACYLLLSEGSTGHPMPVVHYMHLGLHLLTQRTFKKEMPSLGQLETGIMVVEDAVMPLARLVPPSSVLATRDPLLLEIARQAAGDPDLGLLPPAPDSAPPAVTREAIEALFDRLVAQSSRNYGNVDQDLPDRPRWAAALLILREAMHHWQFSHLRLLPMPMPSPQSLQSSNDRLAAT